MDLKIFKAFANKKKPPKGIAPALEAMWQQAKGDWDTAHQLVQSQKNAMGYWVHAFLHRVEGDKGDATYWYQLAGKPVSTSRLDDEWKEIVESIDLVSMKFTS
jgi:hypothetical protein